MNAAPPELHVEIEMNQARIGRTAKARQRLVKAPPPEQAWNRGRTAVPARRGPRRAPHRRSRAIRRIGRLRICLPPSAIAAGIGAEAGTRGIRRPARRRPRRASLRGALPRIGLSESARSNIFEVQHGVNRLGQQRDMTPSAHAASWRRYGRDPCHFPDPRVEIPFLGQGEKCECHLPGKDVVVATIEVCRIEQRRSNTPASIAEIAKPAAPARRASPAMAAPGRAPDGDATACARRRRAPPETPAGSLTFRRSSCSSAVRPGRSSRIARLRLRSSR